MDLSTTQTRPAAGVVIVLGRDNVGAIAELDGFRYYLTDCCGASAKGLENYIGCRACYEEIDPMLGDTPGKRYRWTPGSDVPVYEDVPLDLVEVYGDGITYDQWKAQVGL